MVDDASLPHMQDEDYPALFLGADQAARTAQKNYIWYVKANILLAMGAAAVSAAGAQFGPHYRDALTWAAIGFLVATWIVQFAISTLRFDKQWYDSRGMAETIKTTTWQYVLRIDPYDGDDAEAKTRFLDDIEEAMGRGKYRATRFTAIPDQAGIVTSYMQRIRALPLEARKARYLADRVGDQYKWYASKAASNERAARVWLLASLSTRGIALAVAVITLITHKPPALVTLAAAASVAVTAWIQIGRNEELARAYSSTAEQLMVLIPRIEDANDEQSFSSLVSKTESLMSKEYSMWAARRS